MHFIFLIVKILFDSYPFKYYLFLFSDLSFKYKIKNIKKHVRSFLISIYELFKITFNAAVIKETAKNNKTRRLNSLF